MQIVRELLENAIWHYLDDTAYVQSGKISVTEALYCLRKAYYYRTIEEDVINVLEKGSPFSQSDFYLFVGKVVHEKLQEYIRDTAWNIFKRYGYNVYEVLNETEVENDILIGHIDTIVRTDVGDIPLELKTAKTLPRKAYETHVYQLSTYMVLGQDQFDFDFGYVVYISRTQGDIRIIPVQKERSRYSYVKKRAEYLLDCIANKKPPEREDDPFCWKCVFKSICIKEG